VDIHGGSLGREHQTTTVGLSRTAIIGIFAGYFSDTLVIRPALLYGDTQSVVGFSVIPKCMTLNGYFVKNYVFLHWFGTLVGRDCATYKK